jgi:hypothetical protein
MQAADRAHLTRVLRLTAIAIVVEGTLIAIAHLQPAMAGIFRSAYWVVGIVFFAMILRALRRRKGGDRRHSDRRNPLSEKH